MKNEFLLRLARTGLVSPSDLKIVTGLYDALEGQLSVNDMVSAAVWTKKAKAALAEARGEGND